MNESDGSPEIKLPELVHYDILGVIGQGGMATVYKAVQKSLRRVVAIKELRDAPENDKILVKRFDREALTTSSLSHENVVSIHEYFEDNGHRYLVMEYVGGTDLSMVLTHCPAVPIEVATLIILQVVRALEYAHALGLVHRDVKPGNVMISNEGLVKLTDFGVVQTPSNEALTRPGTFIGTPRYMSPEQILGGAVDFRSDIFSVGILFYELVTGQPLFESDDNGNIFLEITRKPIPVPNRQRPALPPKLTSIIMRCLRRDPKKRFKSTQQLRRQLEDFLGEQILLSARQRIAAFLHNQGLVTSDGQEMPATFGPEKIFDNYFSRLIQNEGRGFGRTFFTVGLAMVLVGMVCWKQNPSIAGDVKRFSGLKVIAKPWGHVFVDGRHRETTPFERNILLYPGYHRVIVGHPTLGSRKYDLHFDPNETKIINIDLSSLTKPEKP